MGGSPSKPISEQISPTNVTRGGNARYANTDELRLAKYLAKALNVAHFDYPAFAYHLVNHAPSVVVYNVFLMFQSIVEVMANRYDTGDIGNNYELEVGVTSKRIIDALEVYRN